MYAVHKSIYVYIIITIQILLCPKDTICKILRLAFKLETINSTIKAWLRCLEHAGPNHWVIFMLSFEKERKASILQRILNHHLLHDMTTISTFFNTRLPLQDSGCTNGN